MRSLSSFLMPIPVSATLISSISRESCPSTKLTNTSTLPPLQVNLKALESRLIITSLILSLSNNIFNEETAE